LKPTLTLPKMTEVQIPSDEILKEVSKQKSVFQSRRVEKDVGIRLTINSHEKITATIKER